MKSSPTRDAPAIRVGRAVAAGLLLSLGASLSVRATPSEIHEIPIAFEHGQIMVDVEVDGKGPFRFHLDTAISPSAVDETVAEKIGLETSGPAGFVAGLGSRRIPYRTATLSSVSVGTFHVTDVETIVWDSSHLVIDGKPLLGVLGESFFRRAWVQIDYPQERLRLVRNDERSPGFPADCSTTGEVLSVDMSGLAPRLLDVSVDGQPVTALLDTGASGALHLPFSEAQRLGFGEKWKTAERSTGHGARGEFEVRKTKADSVTLGAFELNDVDVLISKAVGGILVGNRLLQDFVLTVDSLSRQVCLAPVADGRQSSSAKR